MSFIVWFVIFWEVKTIKPRLTMDFCTDDSIPNHWELTSNRDWDINSEVICDV